MQARMRATIHALAACLAMLMYMNYGYNKILASTPICQVQT
jgi:hypothetical protein